MKPDPGRVTARRLNRVEYNNTVRDLLGVDFKPAADFPADDSGYGFDNIGDVLSLSPVLMEKYLAAAEKIARKAIVADPPPKPTREKIEHCAGRREESPAQRSDRPAPFPVEGDYVVRGACERPPRSPSDHPLAGWTSSSRRSPWTPTMRLPASARCVSTCPPASTN